MPHLGTSAERLPILTEVVARQLEQLRMTGLFTALSLRADESLESLRRLYLVVVTTAAVAARHGVTVDSPGIPAVYNPSQWRSGLLAGYTGRDIAVGPDELIATHFEFWLGAVHLPKASAGHFLKCALWYTEANGGDPLVGMTFLLDLFGQGFIIDWRVFNEALTQFVRYYALGVDLSFISGTTLADVERINAGLSRLDRDTGGIVPTGPRLDKLLNAAATLTLDRAEHAREAPTLDDWLIREARVCGPAWWLGPYHPIAEKLELGVLTRTLLSQAEELSADLHASIGLRTLCSRHALPPVLDLRAQSQIAAGYRERDPAGAWLDRMCAERLLLPNAARELVRPWGADAFARQLLPLAWRMPSARLALPLCVAHGRDPAHVRIADFSAQTLDAEVAKGGLPEARDEALSAARRRLIEQEAQVLLYEVARVDRVTEGTDTRLKEIRQRYPWHPVFCRVSGIVSALRGNVDDAVASLLDCVLMDPFDAQNWGALARFAELHGTKDDANALSEIVVRVVHSTGGRA
jgi:hypothetical protein